MIHMYKPPPLLFLHRRPSNPSVPSTPTLIPPKCINPSTKMIVNRPLPSRQHSPPQRSCSRLACRSTHQHIISIYLPVSPRHKVSTHRPLCESQLHFSSSLSCQSLVILQASADDSCSDREVFVVAVARSVNDALCKGFCP